MGEFQGGTLTGQTGRTSILGGSGTEGGEPPLAQACLDSRLLTCTWPGTKEQREFLFVIYLFTDFCSAGNGTQSLKHFRQEGQHPQSQRKV